MELFEDSITDFELDQVILPKKHTGIGKLIGCSGVKKMPVVRQAFVYIVSNYLSRSYFLSFRLANASNPYFYSVGYIKEHRYNNQSKECGYD